MPGPDQSNQGRPPAKEQGNGRNQGSRNLLSNNGYNNEQKNLQNGES